MTFSEDLRGGSRHVDHARESNEKRERVRVRKSRQTGRRKVDFCVREHLACRREERKNSGYLCFTTAVPLS